MSEPIIEANNLGIRFSQTRRRKLSVRELFLHGLKRQPKGEFWPLRHLSFRIGRGEAVGIIGRNGTGKSTLLKLIAGVLIPDEGKVTVRGKVAPLLELRAGFNEELSGRENVFLLAALHGMRHSEIERRFDEIVDFAEVRDFIDMPLRHYSSGMKVRLGFAVIAQLSHPILLIDEVLAVGDRGFKQKCYATIERMLAQGRTLLIVSHNEKDLERFCTRGLYMNEGKMVVDGTLEEALSAYHSHADKGKAKQAKVQPKQAAKETANGGGSAATSSEGAEERSATAGTSDARSAANK